MVLTMAYPLSHSPHASSPYILILLVVDPDLFHVDVDESWSIRALRNAHRGVTFAHLGVITLVNGTIPESEPYCVSKLTFLLCCRSFVEERLNSKLAELSDIQHLTKMATPPIWPDTGSRSRADP